MMLFDAFALIPVANGVVSHQWQIAATGSTSGDPSIALRATVAVARGKLTIAGSSGGSRSFMQYELPPGTTIRERPRPAVDHLTGDYQVVWLGELIENGRVVRLLAYISRVVPSDDVRPWVPLTKGNLGEYGFAGPAWTKLKDSVAATGK